MTVQVENLTESSTRVFDITGITNKDMVEAILEGLKVTKGLTYPAGFALDADDVVQVLNVFGSEFVTRLPEDVSNTFTIKVNETD